MWILNITPDSFYDWGEYFDLENSKIKINKMIDDGVDIIDVWAFSSRPWAIIPSVKEELNRLLPVLDYIDTLNIDFSVDTCRSEVVEKLLKYKNLKYINDISWLSDEKILDLIAWTNIWYILMHIKWTPKNMQNNPKYVDIIKDINDFFEEKLSIIKNKNINNIILDVWFGFWKTLNHNYILLNNLHLLKKFWYPLLVWLSRKSMIYKLLNLTPNDVLNETLALNLLALEKWVSIIRVHDIKEHNNIIKLFNRLNENKNI